MKKLILLISIVWAISACKHQKEESPNPVEQIETPEELTADFVKSVAADGAKEVIFDPKKQAIQVILPENYTRDDIVLDLTFYEGAQNELVNWDQLITSDKVSFTFRGNEPKEFNVIRKVASSSGLRRYSIYVQQEGKITAELTSEILLQPGGDIPEGPSDYSTANIRFLSGIGTIPESPENKTKPSFSLADTQKNLSITGEYSTSGKTVNFDNTAALVSSPDLSLTVAFGDKRFTFPGKLMIKRAPVKAYLFSYLNLFRPISLKQPLNIQGGYFLPAEKYIVKLESQSQQVEFSLEGTYKTNSTIGFSLPATMDNGSYLVSIFENNQKLSSKGYIFSSDTTKKAIARMWTKNMLYPTANLDNDIEENIAVSRGQSIYADPFPAVVQSRSTPFDNMKNLPSLELRNGNDTRIIKPIVKADESWGDGALLLYYGEYKIPADIATGKYEARLVFANENRSLSFWSLVDVK
ncbi:hypothetical protein L0657_24890 [Dyadobacter sp. CY345]|uniref:hypothetical protein n=1 Tax=Dyadobacter sp. CY345 TaxID=2909335 RepID=UPI001F389114|nr:hypothetical protein [Dyadobacter sp. CY345]MCF2447215.1 hypothetical protein [Dyadobacter sp. CY345]